MWAAAVLGQPAINYCTRSWQSQQGLPESSVTAILQGREGYLWLGTYSGLVRFDGVRFVSFNKTSNPRLIHTRITSLFEDSEGTIWLGNETGDVVRFRNGQFEEAALPAVWRRKVFSIDPTDAGRREQREKELWESSKVSRISADETGDIWCISSEGIMVRVRDGMMLVPPAGAAMGQVGMARDARGFLWITRNGRLSRVEKGKIAEANLQGERADVYVQGLCPSRDGGLWLSCAGRVRKWKDDRWVEDLGRAPWGVRGLTAMIETKAGGIAAGTVDSGLYLIGSNALSLHFGRTNGLSENWVRCLGTDEEGDVWLGDGKGLVSLRAGNVMALTPPEGWEGHAVRSMSRGRDGCLWISTEGGGVYRYQEGQWRHFDERNGLSNLFVWSALEDEDGRLWAGTWGGGMFIKDGDRFRPADGLTNFTPAMTAILHGPDHVTWIGSAIGLLRCEEGRVVCFGAREGLESPMADVRAIAREQDGTIWFGMTGGGLGCLGADGRLRQFRQSDGLSSDDVQCLFLDKEGTLWIGTFGGGLNRFREGHFAAITHKQGLDDEQNVINHIEEDEQGFFWMSSHNGILRVSKRELNACADGKTNQVSCLSFGEKDGLPAAQSSGGMQPAGCRTADGRFCFPTIAGAVIVDPKGAAPNQRPPQVLIEEVLVDNKPFDQKPDSHGVLRIPPGPNQFEFRYTGLSFVVPEKVQFKFWLSGIDKEWRPPTAKRSVPYGYLPQGDYVFQVTACNNDGVWNSEPASIHLRVLPHFWQTWWFLGVTGLASAAAVAAMVSVMMRRRLHRKLEALERQRAIERERARIAKDIHDELGASLTRITMLSQSARDELEASPAAAEVDCIYDTARDLTRAMDEIVWAVNPQHDTLDSLATYLGKFAQDFLAAAHIRCRLEMPIHLPSWPLTAEIRHNLFLAFKEALNNAVKHSSATEVRIFVEIAESLVVLRVEDTGIGFTTNGSANGSSIDPMRFSHGNGLRNMRQRLSEIGGHCEVRTAPGSGTTVTFRVSVGFGKAGVMRIDDNN